MRNVHTKNTRKNNIPFPLLSTSKVNLTMYVKKYSNAKIEQGSNKTVNIFVPFIRNNYSLFNLRYCQKQNITIFFRFIQFIIEIKFKNQNDRILK